MHQQIVEAMGGLRDHDRDVLRHVVIVERIVQIEFRGEPGEILLKLLAGGLFTEIDDNPHEVHVFAYIRILTAKQNVVAVRIEERRNLGEQPLAVMGLNQENRLAHKKYPFRITVLQQ